LRERIKVRGLRFFNCIVDRQSFEESAHTQKLSPARLPSTPMLNRGPALVGNTRTSTGILTGVLLKSIFGRFDVAVLLGSTVFLRKLNGPRFAEARLHPETDFGNTPSPRSSPPKGEEANRHPKTSHRLASARVRAGTTQFPLSLGERRFQRTRLAQDFLSPRER
jgi:hypothetical protein